MLSLSQRFWRLPGIQRELAIDAAATLSAALLAMVLASLASVLLQFDIGWRLPVTVLSVSAICGAIVIAPLVHANRRLAEMRHELEQLAHTDVLTGLPNRRAFFEQAGAMFAANEGGPTALVMIDIDHFKVVNDTYGHDAGDAVLQTVAACIAASARESGAHQVIAARIGGEEFAVAVAGIDRTAIKVLAQTLCTNVRRATCEHRGSRLSVTISIGVALRHANEPVDAVLRVADTAVYEAKRRGRDRWHVADRAMPPAKVSPLVRAWPRTPDGRKAKLEAV